MASDPERNPRWLEQEFVRIGGPELRQQLRDHLQVLDVPEHVLEALTNEEMVLSIAELTHLLRLLGYDALASSYLAALRDYFTALAMRHERGDALVEETCETFERVTATIRRVLT